ncbi:hypothetical protein, partial [Allorhizocola rhizosphaerae]|uniref:hypothetical protein n=1 Tax=Allorhizocola rhizosphaerae TaxID=1872709 RepID=UPI001B8BBBAF
MKLFLAAPFQIGAARIADLLTAKLEHVPATINTGTNSNRPSLFFKVRETPLSYVDSPWSIILLVEGRTSIIQGLSVISVHDPVVGKA